MSKQSELEQVRAELRKRPRDLRHIAKVAGVSYDAALRIKSARGEPGYHKVRKLWEALFVPVTVTMPRAGLRNSK